MNRDRVTRPTVSFFYSAHSQGHLFSRLLLAGLLLYSLTHWKGNDVPQETAKYLYKLPFKRTTFFFNRIKGPIPDLCSFSKRIERV